MYKLLISLILIFYSLPALCSTQITVFGDSLVAGYNMPKEQALPHQLEIYLRERSHDVRVTNAGISGDTTLSALSRIRKVSVEDPHLVIIVFGGNDMLRGVPPEEVYENLKQLILHFKEADIKVMLAEMKASNNYGPEYKIKFDKVYSELATKYKIPLIPFLLKNIINHRPLMQIDGIHPRSAGIKQIVTEIGPIIEKKIVGLHR